MKILQTQTLRGPSYWSTHQTKLILLRLDLETLANTASDAIPGFHDGLKEILPSLAGHVCAPGCRGGFLRRVQEGTLIGQILEQVALELQTLAEMKVSFGRTCETSTIGIYQVIFEYQHEAAGRYAARAALRLCQSIVDTGTYPKPELKKDLKDLARLRAEAALGASTDALVQEAESRGIPWTHIKTCDLFQLGYGKFQKRVQASLTSHSNVLGVELAGNKESTKKILGSLGVPVPLGEVIYAFRELEDAILRLGGYPIVIKPLDGNHGRGITIEIKNWRQAEVAYDRARNVSKGVIVEHFYEGRDHRILVVNHKVVAVAERVPAHVVGNGQATIWELVEQENQDPRRGKGHDNVLTHIALDRATDVMLSRQGYTLETILPLDQICYLRATANLSTGGIAVDRTDEVHPDTVWLAERVSRILDLDVAGLDVLTTDITRPLSETNGVIVEVNAAPGLRMHVSPSQGMGRNVAAPILNMLFPAGTPTRIPIVAVTGFNSNATPTPLIAHIFSQVYDAVGFTTADGTYIGKYPLQTGNTATPQRAQVILQDPAVEVAVLEIGQDEILHAGLAFEHCDVGVVLNVVADQLGWEDVNADHQRAVHQRARVNGVIAETVRPDGYAVLNADDVQVAAMAGRVAGKVAYFSMDSDNPVVRSHVRNGGIAAVYEKGHLAILQDDWVHHIETGAKIPIALGGCTPFMIANALAASLTAFVLGVKVEQIRAALHSFNALTWQTTGAGPIQMQLFNPEYYEFDLLKQCLDFSDEQVTNQEALERQPSVMQPSVLYTSAIALERERRPENQNPAVTQAHSLRERGFEAGMQVEGVSVEGVSVEGYGTTAIAVMAEDRKFDFPTVEQNPAEPVHHFNSMAKTQIQSSHSRFDSGDIADSGCGAISPQLETVRKTLKQDGGKGWMANQGTKAKNWVIAQAPVVAQQFVQQALDIGEIVGVVAFAFGSVAVEMAYQKGKEWVAIATKT